MMKKTWLTVSLLGLALLAFSAQAQDRQTVPDISLTMKDIRGHRQSPFKLDGQAASVFFFILQDCPISNRYAPEIARLVRDYQPKNIRFSLVYVDSATNAKAIAVHGREYNLPEIPAIHYTRHSLVAAVGASITPEVAVVGKQGEILYRGRIDNLYEALGKPRRNITEHDLRNALNAILRNQKIPISRTQAVGCYITAQN
jgi:hypothetical protein